MVAANQALIDFEAAVRSLPEAALVSFRTEPELRQVFLGRSLVPDGWIASIERSKRFNCFLEVDLNHEGLTQWRAKILEYLKYAESGLHTDLFGLKSFRVLVLAKSKARLENVARLARAAGRLFLFAEVGTVNSENILGSVWLSASSALTTALVNA